MAKNPNNDWTPQTGNGGLFTKAGVPAKFVVTGEFEGITIKVIVQPMGEGIITAHPIY